MLNNKNQMAKSGEINPRGNKKMCVVSRNVICDSTFSNFFAHKPFHFYHIRAFDREKNEEQLGKRTHVLLGKNKGPFKRKQSKFVDRWLLLYALFERIINKPKIKKNVLYLHPKSWLFRHISGDWMNSWITHKLHTCSEKFKRIGIFVKFQLF